MGAPRVPRNFVTILIGPTLYLRATETKEAKEHAQGLTQPDGSSGIKGPESYVSHKQNIQARFISTDPSVPSWNNKDMFVELMAVFVRPHY